MGVGGVVQSIDGARRGSQTLRLVDLRLRAEEAPQHPALLPDLLLGLQHLPLVARDGSLHRLEDLLCGRRQTLVDERPEPLDAAHDAASPPPFTRWTQTWGPSNVWHHVHLPSNISVILFKIKLKNNGFDFYGNVSIFMKII